MFTKYINRDWLGVLIQILREQLLFFAMEEGEWDPPKSQTLLHANHRDLVLLVSHWLIHSKKTTPI